MRTLDQLSPTTVLAALLASLLTSFRSHTALRLEILALRHQLGVLQRSVKKPKLTLADRFLWAWLCQRWSDWRSALVIVKPETVLGLAPQRLSTFLDVENPSRPNRAAARFD